MADKIVRAAEDGRYMGAVKLGPKGQIVIPKEVREMLGVGPGDSLLLLADKRRGVALQTFSYFDHLADAVFDGRPQPKSEPEPAIGAEALAEGRAAFAKAVEQLRPKGRE